MKAQHTLGDVALHLAMLEVRCLGCDRHGRLNVARLIREFGPDTPIRTATDSLKSE